MHEKYHIHTDLKVLKAMITRLLAIKPRLITLCALLTFFIMIPLSQSYAQSESVTINPEHLSELIKTLCARFRFQVF